VFIFPTSISDIFVALVGLSVGSFLNVCIARLPRHESIVRPRSYCPLCKRQIRWYDNLPLASYVILQGRCRDCGRRISLIYPLVEILTAGLFIMAWAEYGPTVEFAKEALFCALLVILIFTDLTVRRIPHSATVFGITAGLLLSLVTPVDGRPIGWLLRPFGLVGRFSWFLGALSGAAFGAGLFYIVGEIFVRLRHKQALGFGDVMLMGMVGSFLGVPLTYLTMLLGSIAGSIIGATLYVASARFRREYPWPYGSFLGAAAIYASLGGGRALETYLSWGRAAR
jgi:leader peptidase (prepilin peptidase) / N-methyltransferase